MRKVPLHLRVRLWHLNLEMKKASDGLLDGKEGKPTETKLQRGTKLIYELLADGNAVTIRELDEKAKVQGISQRTMREARSRMKEELDYQMNEKQENTIRLRK